MTTDTHSTILSSLRRFFTGTFLSRVSGLGREVIMAAVFGITPEVAAFWMAFRFAHLLRRLFGEGGLHVVFVPHFEALRRQDPKKGARFFQDLNSGLIVLLLSLILFVLILLGSFLFFGNLSPENESVVRLTMILLPAALFICLFALNSSLLNCEQWYFLPSVSPTILNFAWIAAVLSLRKLAPELAMERLAMLLVFAFGAQWFITYIPTQHILSLTLGKEKSVKSQNRKELLQILRPFLLGMTGVAATQINSGLDVLFARAADAEGPAYLWYALRLQQLPLALFGVGLSGALLPPLSRALQDKDFLKASHFLKMACRQAQTLLIPITFGIFVFGWMSVKLIYGRGEFSLDAITKTTHCLWAYGVGLFPMTLVLILASVFYAMKDYRLPTIFSVCAVFLNCALNSLFVFGLGWGAISIAYATSLSAALNALFLGIFLKRKIGSFTDTLLTPGLKIFCISGFTSIVVYLLSQTHLDLPMNLQLCAFVGEITLFGLLFLGLCYLWNLREIFELLPFSKRIPLLRKK